MDILTDLTDMQSRCLAERQAGKRIAFVPTMGYLHDGHAALLREGRARGDLLVLSIFVNPTQFGPSEDLDRYPRDLPRDLARRPRRRRRPRLGRRPRSSSTRPATPPGSRSRGSTGTLCGASRPGHFRGVTTVVCQAVQHRPAADRPVRPEGFPATGGDPSHDRRSQPAGGDRRPADGARGRRPGAELAQRLPVARRAASRP